MGGNGMGVGRVRWQAAVVAGALAVSAVAIVLAADVTPAGAETRSSAYFEQFLENGELPNDVVSRIAMTDADPTDTKHSAVAFSTSQDMRCTAKQTAMSGVVSAYPVHVFDFTGSEPVKRPEFWGGNSQCTGWVEVDMTPDGLTVVAESTPTGWIPDECPAAGYDRSQIVTWTRSSVGSQFSPPRLVSVAETQPSGCDADLDPVAGEPDKLIGAGGDGVSYWPSISDDASVVAFVSSADNLGVGPLDTSGTRALFVAGPTGDGLEMVTPEDFVGVVSNPQVSGDGDSIVFVAEGVGLDPGVVLTDGPQVFVAERDPMAATGWRYRLVSAVRSDPEDAGSYGPLDGPSFTPQISRDGSRVVFTTAASVIEDGVATDDEETGYWLVARDVSDLPSDPLRVFVNPNDPAIGYPTSDSLGPPEMSGDGQRVAVIARHDGRTRLRVFDVGKALSDPGGAGPAEASIAGARLVLEGGANRPIGLGGNGAKSMVALGGDLPFARYYGSGPALYLGGGGEIGPDISKGLHGDPVDTANGAFLQEETDLVASAVPSVMAMPRSYSSVGDQGGLFGPGWASPLDTVLDVGDEMGAVTLRLPSGRGVTYTESGGVWSTTMGYRSQLSPVSGGGWEVTDPSGDVWSFGDDGLLTGFASDGGSVEVGARSSEGVPATVTASNGDVVTLTDDKKVNSAGTTVSGADGRVDRVATSHSIVVDYGYARNGAGTVLRTVSSPHVSGQGSSTYGRRTYDTAGARITKITDRVTAGTNRVVVENTYDALGRVAHQVNDTGDELTFDYGLKPEPPAGLVDAPGFTTVTNSASGDVTVYEYSPDGEVLGITDALGNSVARSWEQEQPGSSTSRSGVETSHSYDAAGRVTSTTETTGGSTVTVSALTYAVPDTDPDARSDQRVASSTDAAGVTTLFTYDGDLSVPSSSSVPCDEDSLGAALECPSSGLATTVFEYDTDGPVPLLTEQTDPDGVRTTRTYHDDGTLASSTVYDDGDVARTTTYDRVYPGDEGFFFDSKTAWADRTVSPGGEVSWETYDASGRLRASFTSPEDENESGVGNETTYNLDGSVAETWDSESGTTQHWVRRWTDSGWDAEAEGETVAEVRYSQDADGVMTQTKIDRSGDTVATVVGDDGLGEAAVTTSSYGELGRLVSSTGPTGVVTSYHYDVEGRTTGVTTGDDPDDPAHTVSTEYDARGRVVSVTTPMGTDPDGAAVQRKVSYTYDAAGRKVSQLEGAGGPSGEQLLTGFEYDAAGRLWRTVEHRHGYVDAAHPVALHSADRVTETRFTLGGRTAQEVGPPVDAASFDWSGADATKSVTGYGYDEAGRKTSVTAPDEGVTVTAYDVDGRVASVTAPGGYETSYVYDGSGRTVGVVTPSGLTGPGDPETVVATTSFDGQVTCETDPHVADPDPEAVDPSQRCTARTPGGRVASVTDALGNTVSYGYDSRGNRVSRTAVDDAAHDVVESWTYDLADRELTHTVPPPRAGAAAMTTASTYDAEFGWLATVTDPTGRVQTHGYYADGTRRSTTHARATDTPVVWRYWVNGRGWRTKSTTTTASTKTQSWTYDRAGQKLTETSQLGATLTHS